MLNLMLFSLTSAVGWIVWRFFRAYLLKSPLDNIPGPERTSFLKGNLPSLYSRHGLDYHDAFAAAYPPVAKFHAALGARALYVSDPKALHHVIIKESNIYEVPHWAIAWQHLSFGPGLLSTIGDDHRRQRKLLNPVFSIAHMRDLTPIFYKTVHRLRDAVLNQVGEKPTEVNVLNWLTRTALELIGQGGLGYSFDPLTEYVSNPFGDSIKSFVQTTFALHYFRLIYPMVRNIGTPAFRRTVAKWIPIANVQRFREIIATCQQQARSIYEAKKAALLRGDESIKHQVGEGKDIISTLLKANMEGKDGEVLPEEEVIAQMSMLVFAATDTTSSALSRILYLLAEHQDVQDRVRAELREASPDGGDIPYDQLVDLPYLDAVCRETLRLYPPAAFSVREVVQDVVMPFSESIQGVNGDLLTEVLVPKGTTVIIGIRACNRSKAIWGNDALEWKPERWIEALPDSVLKARVPGIYANLLTFFGGSRACIGFKFSQLETKVVLAVMLRTFRFHLSGKDIHWNLATVTYPTVGKETLESSMPLVLETIATRD